MIEEKVSSEEREELSEADDLERTVFEQLYYEVAAIAQEIIR